MRVVRINELEDTQRQVSFTGGTSFRAIIAADNLGFSVNKTVVPKGGPWKWQYPDHVEACYCIKGRGELTDIHTGITHLITPGCIYIQDHGEAHTFEAFEDTVMVSVFNPPLTGMETHDEDGKYHGETELDNYHRAKEIAETVQGFSNVYDAAEYIQTLLTTKVFQHV